MCAARIRRFRAQTQAITQIPADNLIYIVRRSRVIACHLRANFFKGRMHAYRGGKHEGKKKEVQLIYIHRSFLRLRALPDDLQGRRYRGLAQVPILARIIIVQKLQ